MLMFFREKYLVWVYNGLNKGDRRWGPGAVVKGYPRPMDVLSFKGGKWLLRGEGREFEVMTEGSNDGYDEGAVWV